MKSSIEVQNCSPSSSAAFHHGSVQATHPVLPQMVVLVLVMAALLGGAVAQSKKVLVEGEEVVVVQEVEELLLGQACEVVEVGDPRVQT